MKKSILFIMNGLRLGGMERQLVELIKALSGSNIMAYLSIVNSRGPYSDIVEKYLESPVIYLDRRKSKIPLALRTLHKIINDRQIDLIHVQDSFSSYYALPVAKWNRVPLINGMIRHAGVSKGMEYQIEKMMLRFSDIIIANSRAGLNYFGVNQGHIMYNLIDSSRFRQTTGSLADIVMNANFHHFKDHQTFFDAMKVLKSLGRVQSIGLIGDGPNKAKYEELAKRYVLHDITKFYGFIRNVEEVLPEYGIGVLCSTKKYKEGVSNAILEYMGSGLVTVASDIGATSEIIQDGDNGFLFEVENSESLIKKIISIQDDQFRKMKIVESAFTSIERKHSPSNNAEAYLKIINQYLS